MEFAYPRPQLRRSNWTSLNGAWRFRYDDERQYTAPSQLDWPLQIQVPFPPESEASGLGDRGFHCSCWYERDFQCAPGNDRVILRFGAVDYAAKVWVNGRQAATHEGGHTPFAADITRRIRVEPVRRRLEDWMASQEGLPQDLRITDLGRHDEAHRAN